MRLVLGCAQFGMPYGVTRDRDAVDDGELARIFAVADSVGMSMLDVSPAYGNAERRIGPYVRRHRLAVQTKSRGGVADLTPAAALTDFERSCEWLTRKPLDSYLVHGAGQLFGPHGGALLHLLQAMREDGRVGRIGVSVYDSAQVDRVLQLFVPDVVQLPVSVADQRLVADGTLDRLRGAGVTVQARSVFLQGVLLANPADLPATHDALRDPLGEFRRRSGGAVAEHCFGFLVSVGVDEAVIGVHSAAQLETLAAAWQSPHAAAAWDSWRFADDLVDPRTWAWG